MPSVTGEGSVDEGDVSHDGSQLKRSLRTGVRQLLGVPDDESLQAFVEQRGVHLRRRGERAYRSLERVLQGLGIAPPPTPADAAPRVARPEPTKFDLGQVRGTQGPREHIPWGYGNDRVTAMPVDPDRLYVYWEVTDDAMADARGGLGPAGEGAWLSLRVYDVTGRIFDGTNAHGYFDHRVERHDRQWFLPIGKPGSTVCVEIGMKSSEGYFVRIARSARVDFPRAAPVPASELEWMSVRAATGEIEASHTAPSPVPQPPARPSVADVALSNGSAVPAESAVAPGASACNGTPHAALGRRRTLGGDVAQWREVALGAWHEVRRGQEWVGEAELTSWEAGPFPHPVELPTYEVIEQRAEHGHVVEAEDGTHVVEWPWEVTIRGVGAHVERRVLARWEIVCTMPAEQVEESASVPAVVPLGASEQMRPGASERRFAAASELRLAGASEEFLLGASELRFRGASERVLAGASERRWPGASERIAAASGQWQLGGASERLPAGASEHRLGGASELAWHARASWQAFAEEGARLASGEVGRVAAPPAAPAAGASEQRLGGSEERLRVSADRASSATADATSAPDAAAPRPPRW